MYDIITKTNDISNNTLFFEIENKGICNFNKFLELVTTTYEINLEDKVKIIEVYNLSWRMMYFFSNFNFDIINSPFKTDKMTMAFSFIGLVNNLLVNSDYKNSYTIQKFILQLEN